MREAVEQYLRAMGGIHATGAAVRETSYYPALADIVNAIGAKLNPKIRFVSQVRNTGAGIPDAGLFSAERYGEVLVTNYRDFVIVTLGLTRESQADAKNLGKVAGQS